MPDSWAGVFLQFFQRRRRRYSNAFSTIHWWAAFVCSALFVWAPLAYADSVSADDLGDRLRNLRNRADRAVVYIGPHPGAITFRFRMREKDLFRIGCTYEIGKNHINELLDLLAADQITASDQQVDIDARNGVSIYEGKRLLLKLVFSNAYTGEKGMRGLVDGIEPVMSGPTLEADLREFAERFTPLSKNNGCEKDGVAIKPIKPTE